MSDVFTRLAERVLGLALIVQPMIAPLYATESQQAEEPLSLELTIEDENGSKHKPSVVVPVNEQQALSPVPSLNQSHEEQRTAGSYSISHAPEDPFILQDLPATEHIDEKIASVQPNQSSLSTLSETVGSVGHVGGKAIHILADTEQSFVERIPRQAGQEVTTIPLTSPVRESQQAVRLSQVSIPGEQERKQASRVSALPLSEVIHAIPTQEDQVRVKKLVEGERIHTVLVEKQQQDETKSAAHTPEVATPAPTIHVTIGRIEVRATHTPLPTAQQPQRKTTPPVMSLDDYLHQRAKGERA